MISSWIGRSKSIKGHCIHPETFFIALSRFIQSEISEGVFQSNGCPLGFLLQLLYLSETVVEMNESSSRRILGEKTASIDNQIWGAVYLGPTWDGI